MQMLHQRHMAEHQLMQIVTGFVDLLSITRLAAAHETKHRACLLVSE